MLCKIADLFVEVPDAGGLAPRCKEYQSNDAFRADIIIRTERYRLEEYGPNVDADTIAYLESGRQFVYSLTKFQGLYLHASAVEVGGRAYLFSAPSGTGKSTHTRLWQQMFGEKACVFNDDKPALRMLDGIWYAYGTPWCGKDGINVNRKVPVAGICFLKQAPHNQIRRLDAKEAVPKLLTQTTRKFRRTENLLTVLTNLERLVRTIPIFELENRPELDAAQLSYETMSRAALEKQL